MPRAIVLPTLIANQSSKPSDSDEEEHPHYATRVDSTGTEAGDEYSARLVKYIPGEALTFFLAVSSYSQLADVWLVLLLAIATIGASLWALNRNAALKKGLRQPPGLVVVYTSIAFLAWAFGTSGNVQDLIGASQQTCAIIMAIVAFLLPAIDDNVMRWLARRRPQQ